MTKPSVVAKRIANQLKQQRAEKGWSLDKTAQATGVSKAMLGQIERQESSPTIATLWKIATGLECSFSSFIPTDDTSEQGNRASFEHDPHMQVDTLFAFNPATRIETFSITLSQRHEQLSQAHQSGVLEHIHVLEGCLSVKDNNGWHQVDAGQQFLLKADCNHGYRDETGLTTFIDVIYYPPGRAPGGQQN